MRSIRDFSSLFTISILLASGTSCARQADSSQKLDKSHVRALTTLYGLATSKLGHPPHDEKDFKQAIATLSVKPEKMKVRSFDELFVSERDGKPLVIDYGSPHKDSDVLVYEQTGVNGKRLIGHRIGMVEEIDEAQFKELAARKH